MSGITPKYELKIIIDPPIAGKVYGAGKYADGKEVQVDVTAFVGWEFLGWSGDISHSKPNFSIVLNRNITITALFKKVAKPIDRLTILSGVILLLSITTTVYLYIIIDKINKTEQKTGSTIVSESKSLDQKIESLTEEQTNLNAKLESGQNTTNNKIDEIAKDVEKIKNSVIEYAPYEDELTSPNELRKDYKMNIKAGQIVDAYLFDMTADADIWIFDSNSKEIARGSTSDVISNFVIPSDGTYTFTVWNNPTKYKLKVYIRNP
jgi:ribosomal protein L29